MLNKNKTESWLAILTLFIIIIAWFVGGKLENADIVSSIKTKIPGIARLDEIEKATYKIYNPEEKFLGYVIIESSMGYGGPLKMAVAVDTTGKIFDLAIVSSKETPSYLEKVLKTEILDHIKGKTYTYDYSIGNGIDAVSSATYSTRAIVEAAKKGNRYIAAKILGFDVPKDVKPAIKFGIAEIVLLLLFAVGYFAHKKSFRYKKAARWTTMLVGLLVIGFSYNQPFTLSMINQLLLGYFPPLPSHFYWYLLLGGIFLVLTIENKNPYCSWFCPFGAAQECMGLVGGAKNRPLDKFQKVFKWILRMITLFAIVVALLLRNPGVTSFEVFGTLFKLTGSHFQFAILGIVLVSSMFIKRPWCHYLCPIGPVVDYFSHVRKLIFDKWKRKKKIA